VTIRIDQLKDMDVAKLLAAHEAGDRWFISRRNHLEGIVVRHAASDLAPADLSTSGGHRELHLVKSFDTSFKERPSESQRRLSSLTS